LESLLNRDRLVVITGLAAVTILAWGYMAYEAHAMYNTGVCCCAGLKMSGPDTSAWNLATLVPLFLMWSEMMVAMMIPSAAPMILTFAMVQRNRREKERPFVPTSVFLLGYLVVWTGFSALAALAQWVLHAQALLSPMMVGTSPIIGGILLLTAGIFQWTPLKNACLTHCRSPLSFLLTDWREGKRGALLMGLKHGAYCTGCCWILMALLFVAGVMNLWWIAILAVFVLVEKIAPRGWFVGKVVGVLLVAWGAWMMVART
jgi:predicted metal-binding membrane protein